MKIIVDADACPVKNEIIQLAKTYQLEVILVASIAHYSPSELPSHVQITYVEKGADQADFKIVQLAQSGDLIVTQDYGLASLLLPKNCRVLHHKSYEYTPENIERLLHKRHFSAMQRKSGQRTKGPKPFTDTDRKQFEEFFEKLLGEMTFLSEWAVTKVFNFTKGFSHGKQGLWRFDEIFLKKRNLVKLGRLVW